MSQIILDLAKKIFWLKMYKFYNEASRDCSKHQAHKIVASNFVDCQNLSDHKQSSSKI